MAWFSGRVNLGNFPDLAGAVNKISESVKNIEKNFDNALGLEEKPESSDEASDTSPSANRNTLFTPVMSFMGQRSGEDDAQPSRESESNSESPGHHSIIEDKEVETDGSPKGTIETSVPPEGENEEIKMTESDSSKEVDVMDPTTTDDHQGVESEPLSQPGELKPQSVEGLVIAEAADVQQDIEAKSSRSSVEVEDKPRDAEVDHDKNHVEDSAFVSDESRSSVDFHEDTVKDNAVSEEIAESSSPHAQSEVMDSESGKAVDQEADVAEPSVSPISATETENADISSNDRSDTPTSQESSDMVSDEKNNVGRSVEVIPQLSEDQIDIKQQHLKSNPKVPDHLDATQELEKVKMDMKMMEAALQGAARQAQAKADEIAKMMNENETLKTVIEDLKRKSNEAEIESLREEYHQRVATLERKVYALTKERDTLRREQNKKSDAAVLLKEKDEIISQVMAEGEELSKKQAAQESTIRKLRAQIRELEEEKKGLTTNLQVEENKVESIKRDKAATEKLLQETIEQHQAEISAQKEFYTSALIAAKEAEALAEERANTEARTELESRLKEAEEREAMLVQTLEELRQTLTRKEQQAVFREDMLRRDIEDLLKRYQESERRCEELISQVPESTRPLLRQIEAIQESTSRKAEAWAAVERSLNSRLQEAEAKAGAAEERERSINERLSQTLSRVNVLEAQISCLRAEQTQLSRSLEKERQRAAENRQEYLAAKEEADTQEGRASQLEEEIREVKRKHKQELQEAMIRREQLEEELEKEKAARMDLERTARHHSTVSPDSKTKQDNGNLTRKLSTASSMGSMEESYFLQASLDSSDTYSERRNVGEMNLSPFYMKSMAPSAFESALRQKEGELASYMSRLTSMEAIRDSLAEELVKMTGQCEKLRSEASMVPGIKAELEALRRRHSAALELMGERDEELEELRADIIDLKEMYREQVNLLVNQIQNFNSSVSVAL